MILHRSCIILFFILSLLVADSACLDIYSFVDGMIPNNGLLHRVLERLKDQEESFQDSMFSIDHIVVTSNQTVNVTDPTPYHPGQENFPTQAAVGTYTLVLPTHGQDIYVYTRAAGEYQFDLSGPAQTLTWPMEDTGAATFLFFASILKMNNNGDVVICREPIVNPTATVGYSHGVRCRYYDLDTETLTYTENTGLPAGWGGYTAGLTSVQLSHPMGWTDGAFVLSVANTSLQTISVEVWEGVSFDYLGSRRFTLDEGGQGYLFGYAVDVNDDTIFIGTPFAMTVFQCPIANTTGPMDMADCDSLIFGAMPMGMFSSSLSAADGYMLVTAPRAALSVAFPYMTETRTLPDSSSFTMHRLPDSMEDAFVFEWDNPFALPAEYTTARGGFSAVAGALGDVHLIYFPGPTDAHRTAMTADLSATMLWDTTRDMDEPLWGIVRPHMGSPAQVDFHETHDWVEPVSVVVGRHLHDEDTTHTVHELWVFTVGLATDFADVYIILFIAFVAAVALIVLLLAALLAAVFVVSSLSSVLFMLAIIVGAGLVFGTLGGLVASVAFLVRWSFRMVRMRRQRAETKAELAQLNIRPDHPIFSTILDFYVPPSQIQETTLIASGGFGSVSRAVYKGQVVAVKKMHELIQSDPKAMDEFAREARSLVNLRHRHVVGFVGATLKLPNIFLVTEYCQLGSLDQYLATLRNKQQLSGARLTDLLAQAAEGLAFVHSRRFIHRDVKAANFFVGVEDYVALGRPKQRIVVKVGDLGLAVSTKNKTISNVGTPGYSAPEVHQETYTNKVDVFSFGVTMWACFSGREPFDDIPDAHPMQILQMVAAGRRPQLDAVPAEVAPLVQRCWQAEADSRPTMREVAIALRHLEGEVMTANPDATVYRYDSVTTFTSTNFSDFGRGLKIFERSENLHIILPQPENNRVDDYILTKGPGTSPTFTIEHFHTFTSSRDMPRYGHFTALTDDLLFLSGSYQIEVYGWDRISAVWQDTPVVVDSYPGAGFSDESSLFIAVNKDNDLLTVKPIPFDNTTDGTVAHTHCSGGTAPTCSPLTLMPEPAGLVRPFGYSTYLGHGLAFLPRPSPTEPADFFVGAMYNGTSFQGTVISYSGGGAASELVTLVNDTMAYFNGHTFEVHDDTTRSLFFTLMGGTVTTARDGDCLLWAGTGLSRVYVACVSTGSVSWVDNDDNDGPDAAVNFGYFITVAGDIVGITADATVNHRPGTKEVDLEAQSSKLWLFRLGLGQFDFYAAPKLALRNASVDVLGHGPVFGLTQLPTSLPRLPRSHEDWYGADYESALYPMGDDILVATRHLNTSVSAESPGSVVSLYYLTPLSEPVLRPWIRGAINGGRDLIWGMLFEDNATIRTAMQAAALGLVLIFAVLTTGLALIGGTIFAAWHVILLIGDVIVTAGGLVTAVGAVLYGVLQGVRLMQRRAQRKETKAELALLNITPDHALFKLIFSFYVPPSQIQETTLIASGGFGSVSRAVYKGQVVAVKKMHELIQSDPKAMDEFAREARSLVNLRHRHVVGFVGATLKLPNIFLVTEYCQLGSLDQYLATLRNKQQLSGARLTDLLAQAAEGLAFVHSRRFIHRDVKAANFFVGVEDYVALGRPKQRIVVKVGDLGLAVSTKNKTISNVGTPGYSAPEVHQETYTNKVDVFSFGVTMWACFSGREPFDDIPDAHPMQILQMVAAGRRPQLDAVPAEVAPLVQRCWQAEADSRPTMREVAIALRHLEGEVMTANPTHLRGRMTTM
ncbi:Protein tyrosine kinase [Carpediemonas membranifera]|uniref:Protein tyrosine kinase n=1 Tax=Carpediemonas membranifera TaxID=201153 RepID=A0A8J6BWR1_9EUKA|nr:Protein tyrosine kinase [Carpediemonas membranifera]|eukprot:KAG9392691.1 Protein tyrosine kinase [Carpediemonas membranifera]